ncbi:sulfotransferase family protein [Seohaeicola saemankumensis]|nr:sulfotransferase family protein [Seohaeicola saemankumensis]MCA0873475.1 sulfotransferase family protein [Seohaeicola saemankumensis]
MNRTVILHYHLFKNAGTSLDQVLKQNFGDRWVTAEFPTSPPDNSAAVADWIRANPRAVAFSTHTALGPVPRIEGVDLVSVMLLRDPVDRVRSAYRFERRQQADTWGAELAKQHDLRGYVTTRLARPGDRQCRNFQTHRLASLLPGPEPELQRALRALDLLSVVGLVEDFDGTLRRLAAALAHSYPDFTPCSVRANTSTRRVPPPIGPRVRRLLEAANTDDRAVLQAARDMVAELS